jgi:hypothetical protein
MNVRSVLGVVLLAAQPLLAGCASSTRTVQPDLCPVCRKPVADGPELRLVRSGDPEPGIRYRCFMCPIMEGKTGNAWTMTAASGVDGRPVIFRVDGERVVTEPPTAVVLALPVEAGAECLDVHRVFTDESEFRRYVDVHPALKDARPRRFEDVLAEHQRKP